MIYITKQDKNYISDVELTYEIILCKGRGIISTKLEKMIILLCNRIITKMNYNDPMDRDDCLQESIYMCFKNIFSFDEGKCSKSLPFVTEIAKRGLCRGWNELNEVNHYYGKVQKIRNIIHI